MRWLRSFVEKKFPEVAVLYREIRDNAKFRLAKPVLTPLGFKMIGRHDMLSGTFEAEYLDIFKNEILKADLFVDVGANIGYYSCLARHLKKNVISVEPLFINYKYLTKNFEINDWVDSNSELHKIAVGQRVGLVSIFGGDTGASLHNNWGTNSALQKETVTITTLDRLLQNIGFKKIFMKIDVEGFELEAILGAKKFFSEHSNITLFIEIAYSYNYNSGGNPNYLDTFAELINLGFSIYPVSNSGVLKDEIKIDDIKKWLADQSENLFIYNFLCKK